MPAISKAWVAIADTAVDPDSPIDAALMTGLRDDVVHLREWLGGSYTAGAVVDHNHDGVNSALVGTPPGGIGLFGMSTAPSGWLKANGAAVSRTTYSTLFAVIGTTFGIGDGSTTFNVPDLRGEFIRGWDDARGVDSGRALGSWQDYQMTYHGHGGGWYQPGSVYADNGTTLIATSGGTSTGAAGGTSNSSETRPRNRALLACIKF